MPVHNGFWFDPQGKLNPLGLAQAGAVLDVEIHIPPQIAAVLSSQGQSIPPPLTGSALIDTGATLTCVHEPLLQRLGLNPIGIVTSGTANGPVQQNRYPARLVFPVQGLTMDVQAVTGVDLTGQLVPTTPPKDIVCLIGRDFLSRFVFVWNGPAGMWSLSGVP